MSLHKYIERIKYIDYLIRRRATGNAEELATKLGLSVSGTFKFISELKDEGFPISYSKSDKSYYYTKEGCFVKNLFDAELDAGGMRRIMGGENKLEMLLDCNYSRGVASNFGK